MGTGRRHYEQIDISWRCRATHVCCADSVRNAKQQGEQGIHHHRSCSGIASSAASYETSRSVRISRLTHIWTVSVVPFDTQHKATALDEPISVEPTCSATVIITIAPNATTTQKNMLSGNALAV